MKNESLKDAIYLKGKESFIIGFLLIILGIILILPVGIILFIRFLYKMVFTVKTKVAEESEASTHKISSNERSLLI